MQGLPDQGHEEGGGIRESSKLVSLKLFFQSNGMQDLPYQDHEEDVDYQESSKEAC